MHVFFFFTESMHVFIGIRKNCFYNILGSFYFVFLQKHINLDPYR